MIHRPAALLLTALVSLLPVTGCAPLGEEVASRRQELTLADGESVATDAPQGEVTIPVHAHLITGSEMAREAGTSVLDRVMARINCGFSGTRYRFVVVDVDRTVHPGWAVLSPGSLAERDAKRALRRGGADSLNLYLANPADGAAWGTPPEALAGAPTLDGVVLPQSDDARTTTEIGRWIGLYTEFQRGAGGSDAPSEAPVEERAPTGPSLLTTPDPIENFMDYSDDSCMDHFTGSQDTRMDAAFTAYRYGR